MEWTDIIERLLAGEDLSYEQTYAVMDRVMTGELGDVKLAAFLTALSAKGLYVSEIRGLADGMQDHAEPVDVPTDVLDIVGTGGDGAHTVNISTMSAIVLAAAGVPLVKHGNRASTSSCGSADVIEELGIKIDLSPSGVAQVFDELGITFLFANKFHPSMRFAATVRRALGFPTAFNILGPLTNPAKPETSAIGVANESHAPLMAGVFAQRGQSALVFRGKNHGLDELSSIEPAQIWAVHDGEITFSEIDPVAEFGMKRGTLEDLRGGKAHENAKVVYRIMDGEESPIRDAVLLNVAAGLAAFGRHDGVGPTHGSLTDRMRIGIDIARETIDSGKAADLLKRWIEVSKTASLKA